MLNHRQTVKCNGKPINDDFKRKYNANVDMSILTVSEMVMATSKETTSFNTFAISVKTTPRIDPHCSLDSKPSNLRRMTTTLTTITITRRRILTTAESHKRPPKRPTNSFTTAGMRSSWTGIIDKLSSHSWQPLLLLLSAEVASLAAAISLVGSGISLLLALACLKNSNWFLIRFLKVKRN